MVCEDRPVLDKWFEAFVKWPPMNQVVFSAVVLIFLLVLLVLLGVWLSGVIYHITVLFRGWPISAQAQHGTEPLKALGPDWRRMAALHIEDTQAANDVEEQCQVALRASSRNGHDPGLSNAKNLLAK